MAKPAAYPNHIRTHLPFTAWRELTKPIKIHLDRDRFADRHSILGGTNSNLFAVFSILFFLFCPRDMARSVLAVVLCGAADGIDVGM